MALLNRRRFLQLLAAGGAGGLLAACRDQQRVRHFAIPGRFVEDNARIGHQIRQRHLPVDFPPPTAAYDVVIIGGGIAGLSAAWKLKKAGVQRLLLLEMGDSLGGTSQAGQGPNGAFPWGAHYINTPPAEADCIHEVLADLGVIQGYDAANRPLVDPDYLLQWPHERLFLDGCWIKGLDPWAGQAGEPWNGFADDMLRWALYRGRDGRRGFAMPLAYSSRDTRVRELDRISFAAYIRSKGWHSAPLDWLLNYACRDDYGSLMHQVSAWAGIHYFACRFYDYRVNEAYPTDTLTWPEGNGFLAAGLGKALTPAEYQTGSLVLHIAPDHTDHLIRYIDTHRAQKQQIKARTLVYAAKLHTAPYVISGLPGPQQQAFAGLEYSAWLVAAIHLGPQAPQDFTHWDNVFYDSPSLGYVVADHQSPIAGITGRTLVYYLPLPGESPMARQRLYREDAAYWVDQIAADILRVHPELEGGIEAMDLYRWGHAMVRPVPNLIWGQTARWRQQPYGKIHFATCDTTGLPLFEEACYSGIRAAEGCLSDLSMDFTSSLGLLHAGMAK